MRRPCQSLHRDHPRSRGVYLTLTVLARATPGSSPLARGLLEDSERVRPDIRIIPARAGFTTHSSPPDSPAEDHPRSRGVYSHAVPPNPRIMGSSPLARGLRMVAGASHHVVGIIPARAGFTFPNSTDKVDKKDHPRSRGVYYPKVTRIIYDEGSSPLARGLPHDRSRPAGCRRIIPARAGFTPGRPALRRGNQDHPRSRGVYAELTIKRIKVEGSSPLARGLPQ